MFLCGEMNLAVSAKRKAKREDQRMNLHDENKFLIPKRSFARNLTCGIVSPFLFFSAGPKDLPRINRYFVSYLGDSPIFNKYYAQIFIKTLNRNFGITRFHIFFISV